MRIGIYGGTFNPIHIGHMHVADIAAKQANLDKVVFCPAYDPYMKFSLNMAPPSARLAMVKLACEQDDRFESSDVDIAREGPTYTIDTIRDLKRIYPNDDLFFIMGTDAFNILPTWKDYQELIELTNFIVVQRKNETPRSRMGMEHLKIRILCDEIELDVSSTQIREAIKKDKAYKFLLPDKVYDYIIWRNLYKKGYI